MKELQGSVDSPMNGIWNRIDFIVSSVQRGGHLESSEVIYSKEFSKNWCRCLLGGVPLSSNMAVKSSNASSFSLKSYNGLSAASKRSCRTLEIDSPFTLELLTHRYIIYHRGTLGK